MSSGGAQERFTAREVKARIKGLPGGSGTSVSRKKKKAENRVSKVKQEEKQQIIIIIIYNIILPTRQ